MDLIVTAQGDVWQARFGERTWRCAVGRGGLVEDKREGDGATPIGCWPLRRLLYRPDRGARPVTALPLRAMAPEDGWCDDPADPNYNQPLCLPYASGHERLWRADSLYDLVVVLGYNDDPPRAGKGSAIFLHVARDDYGPTEGCVALAKDDLIDLLALLVLDSRVCVRRD